MATRDCDAAVALEEVLDEELQLPRQLLDVERDAVRRIGGRGELGAAPLQQLDERRPPAGRAPRARAGVAAPRCACSVTSPEILQREDRRESSAWPRMAGTGSGIALQQAGDVGERQRVAVNGAGVEREDRRGSRRARSARKYRRSDASPVSGTTRAAGRPAPRRVEILADLVGNGDGGRVCSQAHVSATGRVD